MAAAQILRVRWLVGAVAQIIAHLQFYAGHVLKAEQHLLRANVSLCQDLLEMRPLVTREHRPGCYCIPKGVERERCEPLLNILNVFKNDHEDSVPKSDPSQ